MAKKGDHRIKIGLVCQVCKNRNYITEKNKMETPEKLILKKFIKNSSNGLKNQFQDSKNLTKNFQYKY